MIDKLNTLDADQKILVMLKEYINKFSKFPGRTRLQKLCYFYAVFNQKEAEWGFRPHYYGPYSPVVEIALDDLESIELVIKEQETLGEDSRGFEMRRYSYTINKYGQEVLDALPNDPEITTIKKYMEKVLAVGELPKTETMSVAAKAHYILKKEGKPLSGPEIIEKGKNFGWDIREQAILDAADYLTKLEKAMTN